MNIETDEWPDRVQNCDKCREFYFAQGPGLVGACASVGIEHGKSTWEMIAIYLDRYHANKHRDTPSQGTSQEER